MLATSSVLAAEIPVWNEPLCTDLKYPTINGIAGYWEDGLTPDFFPSIGHSCSYDPNGSGERCGDNICQDGENNDPTTCWEDCVKQPWLNESGNVEQVTEVVNGSVRNKIPWTGNSTMSVWDKDGSTIKQDYLKDIAMESYVMTDAGYMSATNGDDGGGTPDAGCASQILVVRRLSEANPKNPDDSNLYCVEKRYRGKNLRNLLAWTHSAIPDHNGDLLVTNTNDSTLYKLSRDTFDIKWVLNGLHFDSNVSGTYCAGGPTNPDFGSCCSEEGCDISFEVDGDIGSGTISYENMLREVWDSNTSKYRYILSNRSWQTLSMVDVDDNGNPLMKTVDGQNLGLVSWSFGFHGKFALGDDLCLTNYPHGMRYYPDTNTIYSADMTIARVISLPYNHGCYTGEGDLATIVTRDAVTPRAIVRTDSGSVLLSRDVAKATVTKFPIFEVGGNGWQLKSVAMRKGSIYGIPGGVYVFDMERYKLNSNREFLSVTAPMCNNNGELANTLVSTVWKYMDNSINPSPLWSYPSNPYNDVCE